MAFTLGGRAIRGWKSGKRVEMEMERETEMEMEMGMGRFYPGRSLDRVRGFVSEESSYEYLVPEW